MAEKSGIVKPFEKKIPKGFCLLYTRKILSVADFIATTNIQQHHPL